MDNENNEKTCNGIPINEIRDAYKKNHPSSTLQIEIDENVTIGEDGLSPHIQNYPIVKIPPEIPITDFYRKIDPDVTSATIIDMVIFVEILKLHISLLPTSAWCKFCNPGLNRDADGFWESLLAAHG